MQSTVFDRKESAAMSLCRRSTCVAISLLARTLCLRPSLVYHSRSKATFAPDFRQIWFSARPRIWSKYIDSPQYLPQRISETHPVFLPKEARKLQPVARIDRNSIPIGITRIHLINPEHTARNVVGVESSPDARSFTVRGLYIAFTFRRTRN
jgi:hypothetical protein